jgi:hypothetical protein
MCGQAQAPGCDGVSCVSAEAGAANDSGGDASKGGTCGTPDDAGMQEMGPCPVAGQTCCHGGAVGTYYCTTLTGDAGCPAVP